MTSDLSLREWLTLLIARLRSAMGYKPPAETEPSGVENPTSASTEVSIYEPITIAPRDDVPHVSVLLPFLPRVEERLTSMEQATLRLDEAKGLRADKIMERDEELTELASLCRIFRNAVEGRHTFRKFPLADLTVFRLREPGTLPSKSTSEKWIVVAQDLKAGDILAEAKGYAPMLVPNRADIATRLQSAELARDTTKDVESLVQLEQLNMREERERCQGFAREVSSFLRHTYHTIPAVQLRRFMRQVGFTYVNDNGDIEEEPNTTELETETPQSVVEVKSTQSLDPSGLELASLFS